MKDNVERSDFEYHSVDNCLVIRFLRSEQRNPLTTRVVSGLIGLFNDLELNSLRKVVFTGSSGVFAAGADLNEIASLDQRLARDFSLRGQSLMNKIASLTIPTVAAINGYCFGGGLDLALACDKRIAVPNAVFSHPGVSLGIITGWGGTQRLPRLIGEAAALEMLLTAGRFDADSALRKGLVDAIDDDPLNYAISHFD